MAAAVGTTAAIAGIFGFGGDGTPEAECRRDAGDQHVYLCTLPSEAAPAVVRVLALEDGSALFSYRDPETGNWRSGQ